MATRLYAMAMGQPVLYLVIGVIAITTILIIPVTNAFSVTTENPSFTNNNNASKTSLLLNTISQRLNNTIANLMGIAEASMNRSNSFGKLPQAKLTSDIKIKFHGIPSDQELEKRIEAKVLLANNKALLYVGLLLPNGDRYFGEPYYPYQTNSSVTNFAYKDHFIGALKTKQPYLSNVFKAVTTGQPLAILASPIYADVKNHQSLIGVQVLGLNFSYFNDLVKSIMPPTIEASNIKRIVLVDNNGTGVADSSFDNKNKTTESFKNLQSFQNAKNGETGSLTENVNGKNMLVSYTPIKFAQTRWIALLFSC
ncbi:MAG TPA: cache domain-containing protein [Nitrososphaeraceae archaeon]|nr:cache domain-containing protein [Nitrososphaeraceae archaeon]